VTVADVLAYEMTSTTQSWRDAIATVRKVVAA
jgi:hypothetical protein